MNHDVAVVIPAFEAAAFIVDTLRSVSEQTCPPAEIIVVDDGSKDDTAALAEQAGARVLRQANQGPAAARNHGVRASTAPWIAFLDADDQFLPAKLERQIAQLRDFDLVALGTDAYVDPDHSLRKNSSRTLSNEISFDLLIEENPLICSSMLVARSAFDQVGGFDENRALIATEDYDLWLRLARIGTIGYLDEALSYYRVHAESLSDDRRFAAGIDLIMAKVVAAGDEAGLRQRCERRRGRARLDAAYHLAKRGDGASARVELAQARALGVSGIPAFKTWLRSWMG